jgi:hypothetical protein
MDHWTVRPTVWTLVTCNIAALSILSPPGPTPVSPNTTQHPPTLSLSSLPILQFTETKKEKSGEKKGEERRRRRGGRGRRRTPPRWSLT